MHVQMTNGKIFMLVATDQAGTECEAWYLSNKSKEATVECLKGFDTRVETQLGVCVKRVQTDGGKEFVNDLWEGYCMKRGIHHK